MNIAQNLKHLMEERGLSNSRLAREIHVHTSTVSNWLDGKEVKSENLTTLCKYFGCSLDYLTGSTTETKKTPTGEGGRAVSDDDIKFALFGGEGEITDAMFEEVKRFAHMVKLREEAEKEKK
jgi:transcriptional regulator with XRE-family HTH domain